MQKGAPGAPQHPPAPAAVGGNSLSGDPLPLPGLWSCFSPDGAGPGSRARGFGERRGLWKGGDGDGGWGRPEGRGARGEPWRLGRRRAERSIPGPVLPPSQRPTPGGVGRGGRPRLDVRRRVYKGGGRRGDPQRRSRAAAEPPAPPAAACRARPAGEMLSCRLQCALALLSIALVLGTASAAPSDPRLRQFLQKSLAAAAGKQVREPRDGAGTAGTPGHPPGTPTAAPRAPASTETPIPLCRTSAPWQSPWHPAADPARLPQCPCLRPVGFLAKDPPSPADALVPRRG